MSKASVGVKYSQLVKKKTEFSEETEPKVVAEGSRWEYEPE